MNHMIVYDTKVFKTVLWILSLRGMQLQTVPLQEAISGTSLKWALPAACC